MKEGLVKSLINYEPLSYILWHTVIYI